MFSRSRIRPTLLSVFALVLLLMFSTGAPGANAKKPAASPAVQNPVANALPSCTKNTPPVTAFNSSNFPSSPKLDNPLYLLPPGTKLIFEGFVNSGTKHVEHQIITTVTDMTKVIDGVPTVVLWDRDIGPNPITGQMETQESELAFHAQDTAGNPWNLGEYPAVYVGGVFSEAPDTWIAGLPTSPGQPIAKAGNILPGTPQVGTPSFLQAYAAPGIILDCGQVSKIGQHVCNVTGCYDNAVIVEEISPPDTFTQLKYYAPGVGNFQIDPAGGDPLQETLVLSKTIKLNHDECMQARQEVLALEDQAYHNDTTQTVYKQTAPMTSSGYCETLVPPPPPKKLAYLPMVTTYRFNPPLFDNCQSDPDPASAPNYPIQIVNVNKITEVVTLRNVSDKTISLEDWNLCSINGNQEHDQIYGAIAPGQTRDFPNVGGVPIWADNQRDDAALYSSTGYLVSYWVDHS